MVKKSILKMLYNLRTIILIFSFGLLTGCNTQTESSIWALTNINGYTFNDSRELEKFDSMVIDAGKIVAIGRKSVLKKFPKAAIVDGQGKTIIPGITDAHGHVSSLGYTLLQIDLRESRSAQQAAREIARYAKQRPYLNWIKGRGWNQVLWPGKQFPSANILDELVSDRPVWLERIDGHAGWANTKALELAGVNSNTLSPPGGEILRDANGQPTGILIDNAMSIITRIIPPASDEELSAAIKTASDHLLSLGITAAHDAGVSARENNFYKDLADKGQLSVRLYAMISSTDPELGSILSEGPFLDDDFYNVRSVKVYTDGALGSRGAALIAPYSDRPGHSGLLLTSQEQLRNIFFDAIGAGFQVAIHAIGDKGNRIGLDEIEYAYSSIGGRQLRHRIEHAQVVSLNDISRFKELDVIPSMQPTHATSDMNMAEQRIGKHRLEGAYAWRSFIDQGSRLASGSDFPIELANPFHGIHAAVTRQNHKNEPKDGWRSEQSISTQEALRSFTIDAAWAAHQEKILGGLTVGKWADFIIIDRDIFSVPKEEIWKTKVLETWVAGKLAYERS
mgnify:CR=1 FL=1|jgi:hypothetical protein